jgi:hypothetical protein
MREHYLCLISPAWSSKGKANQFAELYALTHICILIWSAECRGQALHGRISTCASIAVQLNNRHFSLREKSEKLLGKCRKRQSSIDFTLSSGCRCSINNTIKMKYMLIFKETEIDVAQRDDPEKAPAYWGAWSAYAEAVASSGIMLSGEGLQPPSTATTVRIRDGKREVHDGPYSESKEMLAGFFVIDVPDLDAALEWAARSPSSSYASTEVRPVLLPMQEA